MLKTGEIKSILTRPNVHVFVDGGDLCASLEDANYSEFVKDSRLTTSSIISFCRSLGNIRSAEVYDDDWAISQSTWQRAGFYCVPVTPELSEDSRVAQVLTLRAYQTAAYTKGHSALVLVVGASNHEELILATKEKGIKTILIGLEEVMNPSTIKLADIWIPIHEILKKSGNIKDYDWANFIRLIDDLEKSKMKFVGVKHLIRKVLPDLVGVNNINFAYQLVENAENLGIIEMHEEKNLNDSLRTVKACKLVRSNAEVMKVFDDGSEGEDNEEEGEEFEGSDENFQEVQSEVS